MALDVPMIQSPSQGSARSVGQRYPSSSRLLTKAHFDAVFQGAERRRSKGDYLVMYSIPNSLGQPRLGLVVPKRQARRAVDRNRVKRCVREAFRRMQTEVGDFDLVVQLTRLAPADALHRDIERVLRRFVDVDRQKPPSRGRSRSDARRRGQRG